MNIPVRTLLLLLMGCLLSVQVQAQILILIHGYPGQGGNWRDAGMTHILQSAGWQDGGHLRLQNRRVIDYRLVNPHLNDKTFYTLDMPYEAPINIQSALLARYMRSINARHPGESLNLSGFSAGGVVARMYMVNRQSDEPRVATLTTIASPHLGTYLAEMGIRLHDNPLTWMMPYPGAEIFHRSGRLFQDLLPERPGNFLYWLNRQRHPAATYISIIRQDLPPPGGDMMVSGTSQNMNNIPALRGRSYVLPTTGGHRLTFQDVLWLVQLMQRERQI